MPFFNRYGLSLWVGGLALIVFLFGTNPVSDTKLDLSIYLPIRAILTVFCIGISSMIFGLGWNTLEKERMGTLTLLACGFLTSNLLTFLQLISHPGYPPFITTNTLDKSVYFQTISRAVIAIALTLTAYSSWKEFWPRKLRYLTLALSISIIAAAFTVVVYHLESIPQLVIIGEGPTRFKLIADSIVIGLFLAAAWGFYRRISDPEQIASKGLCAGTLILAIAQFRTYSIQGMASAYALLGHIYAGLAYCTFYRAIFLSNFRIPYAKLEQSNDQLKRVIATRDEFLSIASHELKTPLTPLKIQLQAVQRHSKAGNLDQEEIALLSETADRQISRLNSLIDEILEVSQVGVGKLSLELSETDLSASVRKSLDYYESKYAASGGTITTRIQAGIIGRFDPVRIQKLMAILIENAMKFGLGRPIEVTLASDGETAKLIVRDQGIGIAAEDRSRIFDRFERIQSPINVAGLGLGLFIAREIVRAHGGMISVESQPGMGATFVTELPLHTPTHQRIA